MLTHWESRPAFGLIYFFIGAGFLVAEFSTATFPVAMIMLAARERDDMAVGGCFVAAALGSIPAVLVAVGCGECLSYLAGAPAGLMSIVVVGLSIDGFYFSALTALEEYRMTIVYRCLANAGQLILLAVAVVAGIASVGVVLAIYALIYLVPIAAIELSRGPYAPFVGDGSMQAPINQKAYGVCCSVPRGWLILWRHLRRRRLPGAASCASGFRDLRRSTGAGLPLIIAPTAIGTVVAARTAGAPPEEQWAMLRRVVGAGIGIAVIGSLVYAVLAGPLVSLFYGHGYEQAASQLRLVAAALAVLGVHHCCSIGVSALDSRVCRQSASASGLDRGGSRVFHSPYARGGRRGHSDCGRDDSGCKCAVGAYPASVGEPR